jgi:hypothetical protein
MRGINKLEVHWTANTIFTSSVFITASREIEYDLKFFVLLRAS